MTAVPDTDITPLRPGLVLDKRYELLSIIGTGGMAQVWQARQLRLGRTVALKVLLPTLSEDTGFQLRFEREGETLAKLRRHPHIVGVIDSGVDKGHTYIVMEHIPGDTLENRLRSGGTVMSGAEVLDVLEPIADAVDAAHRHDLVHRDIKPANILLEEHTDHPFLADFGIAKDWNAGSLTNTRNQFATFRYASPELFMDAAVQSPSDIYSLGLVAYEALTGGHGPYLGMEGNGLFGAHLIKPPLKLLPADDPSSAAVYKVLCRALAKKPADRTPTATQFIEDLRAAISAPALDRRPAYSPLLPDAAAADNGDSWDRATPATHTAELARPRDLTAEIPEQVSERIAELAFMDAVSGDTAELPTIQVPTPEPTREPGPAAPPSAPPKARRRKPLLRVAAPPWWPLALAAPLLALPIAAFLTRPDTPTPAELVAGAASFQATPGTKAVSNPAPIAAATLPQDVRGDTIAVGDPDDGIALTTVRRGRVPLAPDDAGTGRLVRIAGGQARRYQTPRRTVVVGQTNDTVVWLACRRPEGAEPTRACERAIATLTLDGDKLQGDPLPQLARQLSAAQERPKASRDRLPLPVRDLQRRADRADSIADAYGDAVTVTRKLGDQRPRDRDLKQLEQALDETRAAYRDISAAAGNRSVPGDERGRQALRRADTAVDEALARFATRGYTIGGAAQ